MWTTIKSLDPRTVLAALRRPTVLPKPPAKAAEPDCPAPKRDWASTILSYDNLR